MTSMALDMRQNAKLIFDVSRIREVTNKSYILHAYVSTITPSFMNYNYLYYSMRRTVNQDYLLNRIQKCACKPKCWMESWKARDKLWIKSMQPFKTSPSIISMQLKTINSNQWWQLPILIDLLLPFTIKTNTITKKLVSIISSHRTITDSTILKNSSMHPIQSISLESISKTITMTTTKSLIPFRDPKPCQLSHLLTYDKKTSFRLRSIQSCHGIPPFY